MFFILVWYENKILFINLIDISDIYKIDVWNMNGIIY